MTTKQKNFLGIESPFSSYEQAAAVIIPIPYEQTTSYGAGTREGAGAIIDASSYVELYDEELDCQAYEKGIHTLPVLQFSGEVERDFQKITMTYASLLKDGKFPVGLGGEHSISFPAYRAFHDQFQDLSILQLDAHSDLRDSYEGSIYSHASVMRRIYELNSNIVQVGIRSQCFAERQFIEKNGINIFYAHPLQKAGISTEIIDLLKKRVFLTIDVDFFDPSVMPSTGTPEPGGFLWDETIEFLKRVFAEKQVVGFDVVELSPIKGLVHADFLAAKLVYKLLGYKFCS